MKQVQTGAQGTKWKLYKEKYGLQAAQVIEGFTQYADTPGRPLPKNVNTATRKNQAIVPDDASQAPPPSIIKQVSV
jgi:hypothetical protein